MASILAVAGPFLPSIPRHRSPSSSRPSSSLVPASPTTVIRVVALAHKSEAGKVMPQADRALIRLDRLSEVDLGSNAKPFFCGSGILLQLAASMVFFFIGIGTSFACADGHPNPVNTTTTTTSSTVESIDLDADGEVQLQRSEELDSEFEAWKSKKFALTVPIRFVALRGTFPASWIKDFFMSQSQRAKVTPEFRGNIRSIYSELLSASKKASAQPRSIMSADIVSIGDSWLNYAIRDRLIEPIHGAKDQKCFTELSDAWKTLLCRNDEGEVEPHGKVWGIPYRWGNMVIAYNKEKFRRKGLSPIEDWEDLWRPELAGKISMVCCPREVVGATLKYMGSSYNTKDIDSQIPGGRMAVLQKLKLLQRQVKLFDSIYYLKAFTTGDVWVAVGWSSDVLPIAKRMSNVSVVIPKSGSSIWADLWVTPATSRLATHKVGGRVRGPSPLIYQWVDFCLQPARAFPFKQEIIPGLPPSMMRHNSFNNQQEKVGTYQTKHVSRVSGVPSSEILEKCEFLEPLSEKATADYQWLVTEMESSSYNWVSDCFQLIFSGIKRFNLDSLRR